MPTCPRCNRIWIAHINHPWEWGEGGCPSCAAREAERAQRAEALVARQEAAAANLARENNRHEELLRRGGVVAVAGNRDAANVGERGGPPVLARAAAASAVNVVADEGLTCCLCKSEFVEPVTLACPGGHSFCKGCIALWLSREQMPTCPLDRASVPRELPAVSRELVAALAAAAAAAARRGSGGDARAIAVIPEADVELGAVIGSGGFGIVRRGTWRGAPVAVKSLQRASGDANDAALRAFDREMLALSQLRHPNIIAVFGVVHHADASLS